VNATDQPSQQADVKPTIVLVHGAFADASSWNGVIERLQQQGYTCIASANPLRGVTADSAYTASLLSQIDGPGRAFLRRRGHHQRRGQRSERRRPGLRRRLRPRRG
jgi:alpha-beta hydrolase superfamily lysophospholipase